LLAVVGVGVLAEHVEHRRLRVAHAPQGGAERGGGLRVDVRVRHGRQTYPVEDWLLGGKVVICALPRVPRVDFSYEVRDVRKLMIALALTMALGVVAAASAALPHAGARYTGPTNSKVVNGFGNTVTFLAGARSLKRFSFGTLGCFGYGTFPVGVD